METETNTGDRTLFGKLDKTAKLYYSLYTYTYVIADVMFILP